MQISILRFMAILALAVAPALFASSQSLGSARPKSDAAWLAAAQHGIAAAEYEISWAQHPADEGPASFQAPNRRQSLRFVLRDNSLIRALPRQARGAERSVGWRLAALARDEQQYSLKLGTAVADGRRISWAGDGVVLAAANHESGLKLELELASPPVGDGALRVLFALDEGTTLGREPGGRLILRAHGDSILALGAPVVQDAIGRPLPAHFESSATSPASLELVVDDRDATAPLHAKLTAALPAAPAWYAAGDDDTQSYGFSVATAGDLNGDGYSDVVIGAPGLEYAGYVMAGAAHVYYGSSSGLSTSPDWSFVRPGSGWQIGFSASTIGDVNGDGYSDLAVGAPYYENGLGSTFGAVFVFYGSSTGLPITFNPDWEYTPGYPNDGEFGYVVAPAGDTNGDGYSDMVVGMPAYDTGSNDGAILLFLGSSSGLEGGPNANYHGQANGRFGAAVATAGDFNNDGYSDVVVGEPYWDGASTTDSGCVWFFPGESDGTLGLRVGAFSDQDGAHLGASVATAGDVDGDGFADVVAGAPDLNGVAAGDAGGVYLYLGSASFNTTADWSIIGTQENAHLGASVATAGDVNGDGYGDVLVGESGYSNGVNEQGRALLWLGGANGLASGTPASADWSASSGSLMSHFGASVATAGDVNGDGLSDILIGAPDYSYLHTAEGLAFLFLGQMDLPSSSADWTLESNMGNSNFGMKVATAGDVNGDGYADVLVGAPYLDASYFNEGGAFLYLGSASGLPPVYSWASFGAQSEANYGSSVASAGDLDGDGFSDVVVGAPYFDSGANDSGAVFVWYGSSSGLGASGNSSLAGWVATAPVSGGLLGSSACAAGDLNGDGYADLAIGAPGYSDGSHSEEGAIFLWHGASTGLGDPGTPSNADWSREGDAASLKLGASLAPAGDVNGDGYADLMAGGLDLAAAWYGSISGLRSSGTDWVLSRGDSSLFGAAVAGVGDVNGDGFSDVVVGAPFYNGGSYTFEGAAWAYCGSAAGLSPSTCWMDLGGRDLALFGFSVAGGGDLNRDGYADILAGAPGWSNPSTNEGQIRAYFGSALGPVSLGGGDWTHESNTSEAQLGRSVAGAGDINGDTFADILAGSPAYSNGQSEEGKVELYYGTGRPGVGLLPRQLCLDQTTPIAPGGRSDSPSYFVVALTVPGPAGPGKSTVGVEAKAAGTVVDGSYWSGNGFLMDNGGLYGSTISGTEWDTAYHWRVQVRPSPVSTPYSPPALRWFHLPWGGFNENTLRTAGEVLPDKIFSDDFENGLGAWTSHVP